MKYLPYFQLHSKITVGTKLVYPSLEKNKANYTYICDRVLKYELLKLINFERELPFKTERLDIL